MKILVPMLAMVVLAMSVGCGRSLDNEAVNSAKEYWKLTQIGGSTYLCKIGAGAKTVYEFRNIKVHVTPQSLSEADKLNGVEWRGSVSLKADAVRRYRSLSSYSGELDMTWSPWFSTNTSSAEEYMDLQKSQGEWKFSRFDGDTFKQVEASDLPK